MVHGNLGGLFDSGVKFATGKAKPGGGKKYFNYANNRTDLQMFELDVQTTQLKFEPKMFVAYGRSGSTEYITLQEKMGFGEYTPTIKVFTISSSEKSTYTCYNFKYDERSTANIASGYYTFPVASSSVEYSWIAIG